MQISHATQLGRFHLFSHAYHYCQELHRLYLPHLPYSNGSQVFQPCNDLWYLPKICSRISQICLCISVSKSLRWSRNIAMMSRWFALRRTSSSNGKSHSKRTSKVCISRKTLVTLSNPIIQPMYCSSIASRNGRLLVRLSILSTDRMAILFLSLNASFQQNPVVSQLLHSKTSRPVVGVLIVQTPHLCLQDLLPTSTYQSYLFLSTYLQASCRSPHLSKHLTCAFRTYSQLQPTNLTYFSLLISRQVVGVLTCPNTSLVSPGLTPNLSLSRYSQCSSPGKLSEFSLVQTPHLCLQDLLPTSACRDILKHFTKTCRFRQSIDKSLSSNDLTANMPKKEVKQKHII